MKTDRPARIGSREVVEQLKDWIKHGLLVPGQRLVEADVVRDSGASRAHSSLSNGRSSSSSSK